MVVVFPMMNGILEKGLRFHRIRGDDGMWLASPSLHGRSRAGSPRGTWPPRQIAKPSGIEQTHIHHTAIWRMFMVRMITQESQKAPPHHASTQMSDQATFESIIHTIVMYLCTYNLYGGLHTLNISLLPLRISEHVAQIASVRWVRPLHVRVRRSARKSRCITL